MSKTNFKVLLWVIISLGLIVNFAFFLPASSQVKAAGFAYGADIGWLQQMEATGYKFYNDSGVQQDCLQILKDHGINTIRLRVWVNPSADRINGHCSKAEVVTMAVRAQNMGFRIVIDFHYSDSWADPGKQVKPAAWSSHSFSQLLTDVYNHTYDVINTLKSNGVTPEWVQVGNEITPGMLLPDGSTSNWTQLAQLINQGYDAVKAVSSSTKVILHIDQGNNNSRFRSWFDGAKNAGAKYDVIGASYYPYWLGSDYTATINNLGTNLNDMAARYGKEVMVVEVGGDYTKVQNTYDMLVAVINKVMAVPNSKGLGVIYWEPEGAKSWSGYQLSCWGDNGRPTTALDAFIHAGVSPTPTRAATPTPTRSATPTPTRGATPTPTRPGVTATPTPTSRVTPTPTRRVEPTPTRQVTASPTATVTNTPTPTTGTGGIVVAYVVSSDWGAGASISVTITNKTTTAINGWTLVLTFPSPITITNIWGATYTVSGNTYTFKDAGYNANIPANGGSVNFGFNMNYSGSIPKPSSATLNGTPCTIQ